MNLNENFLYFFYENANCKNITSADTSVSFDEFEKYLSKYFDISQMDFGKLYSYNAEDNTIKISAAYNRYRLVFLTITKSRMTPWKFFII